MYESYDEITCFESKSIADKEKELSSKICLQLRFLQNPSDGLTRLMI